MMMKGTETLSDHFFHVVRTIGAATAVAEDRAPTREVNPVIVDKDAGRKLNVVEDDAGLVKECGCWGAVQRLNDVLGPLLHRGKFAFRAISVGHGFLSLRPAIAARFRQPFEH